MAKPHPYLWAYGAMMTTLAWVLVFPFITATYSSPEARALPPTGFEGYGAFVLGGEIVLAVFLIPVAYQWNQAFKEAARADDALPAETVTWRRIWLAMDNVSQRLFMLGCLSILISSGMIFEFFLHFQPFPFHADWMAIPWFLGYSAFALLGALLDRAARSRPPVVA